MHFQIFYPDLINKSEAPEYFLVTFFVSISYTNYVIIVSIFGLTKEMLPILNRVVGCSVCSWATVYMFQVQEIEKRGCHVSVPNLQHHEMSQWHPACRAYPAPF